MAEAAADEGFSLSKAFSKVNHIRHWIMDISMVLMAVTAVVTAAGPMVGIFDPIGPFIKMHFAGFAGIGDLLHFFPDAVENLGDGVLLSDTTVPMDSLHAGHMPIHNVTDAGSHFNHASPPLPEEKISSDAEFFGTDPNDYEKAWCPPLPGQT